MPNARIGFERLPNETGGALVYFGGRNTVTLLDKRLSQAERTAAHAHELLHLERGSVSQCPPPPPATSAVPCRSRWSARRTRSSAKVALRLVPLDELGPVVDRIAGLGHGVTPAGVAEQFEVPPVVASRALTELATVRARRMSA